MILPPIFPAAEDDGCEPCRQIANKLNCTEHEVIDAFSGLEIPEWSTPEHYEAVKISTLAINESARLAEKLIESLERLPSETREDLIISGAVSLYQIEYLAALLAEDAKSLEDWRKSRYSGGRINPAAHIVAEGMRRLFRRRRKPITFGQADSGGGPSTEFGRAVEFALAAFGVRANWLRAAEKAYQKQEAIQARRGRCLLSHWERGRANANREEK